MSPCHRDLCRTVVFHWFFAVVSPKFQLEYICNMFRRLNESLKYNTNRTYKFFQSMFLPMKERDPLQHESSRSFDTASIGSPVLESVIRVLPEYVESLRARYIDQLFFFDFSEDPRFDQSSATNCDTLYRAIYLLHSLIVVKRENIAVSKYRYGLRCHRAFFYIFPIS